MNGFIYQYVALILQASEIHNIPVPGGRKYNIPSGSITIDHTATIFPLGQNSYTGVAVTGADDFSDQSTTIREVFDIVVAHTRQNTPTCKLFTLRLQPFVILSHSKWSWDDLDGDVRTYSWYREG